MGAFADDIQRELRDLDGMGLRRSLREVRSKAGPEVTLDGRAVLLMCSNDYLGFAAHPKLAAAAIASVQEDGYGAPASRLISGTTSRHREVEAHAARFVRAERSVFFPTGYAANVGCVQALVGEGDLVVSDALNHASLIDGCRLSRATVIVAAHCRPEGVAEALAAHRHRARRALVVTESVFSMDGDVADLAALREIADRYDAGLFVDEAHALGVLGPQGRGVCNACGVVPDILVGTFGKAFGASGAFVAGGAAMAELVENRARSFVFSTASPPLVAAVASAAIDLVERADDERRALQANIKKLRRGLAQYFGEKLLGTDETPIVPVVLGAPGQAMDASRALLERGVYVQGIRPPTVPRGTSRLRIVPTAAHTDEHIARALAAFADVAAGLEL